ncbi:site-specific recombinase XerD [Evansella vedderi]|uniref:Site-specific recombinase XerD n=1 Tax=Evansella vedderi TaxID=38282 RepID=A0ABT9ZZW5_9BACI|nr:tyrosine-type recombinase/integrase [Evansella vedderi]MDQ0256789.1 site-specific recombinase XerD [Evansella vedderi]
MKNHHADSLQLLDSFESYLRNKGRSENTIKTYYGVLQSFFSWIEKEGKALDSLSNQEVESYIHYLENENKSTSTIKKVINTINTFAKFLGMPELMNGIQVKEEKTTSFQPDYLVDDEVNDFLKKIEDSGNKRNIAIAYTILNTGIRVSELCSLNKNNVVLNSNHQTGQLVVGDRTIPVPMSLAVHLKNYLKVRSDKEDALFVSNYQKRISPRTVQHMLQQYGVHPHKLRHTFCYQLIKKGLDPSVVAQLAGYSDINMIKQFIKFEAVKNQEGQQGEYA